MEVNYIAYSSSSYPEICFTSTDYEWQMAQGYKEMAMESLKFAEEALPLFNEIAEDY